MSRTFTVSGQSSVLHADFYPPIELEGGRRHGLGLLGFYSYNSIHNIDESNNVFAYKKKNKVPPEVIRIPPGAYEIEEISKVIYNMMKRRNENKQPQDNDEKIFSLKANNNTLKCEIYSMYEIDFTTKNSIGSLLGFEAKRLQPNKIHESTLPVNIMKVRIVRIDCNITTGAYLNGELAHTLFEFDMDVEPGHKLTKEPQNIIYMPVTPDGRQFIDNITLNILDDNGDLVNFHGEKIIIKLELKSFV